MNKKGFTLIELLATVFIIALISVIIISFVITYIDRTKERAYVQMVQNIEYLSRLYISYNRDDITDINEVGASTYITLGDLVDYGMIKAPVIEPVSGNNVDLNSKIYIKVLGINQYDVVFSYKIVGGPEYSTNGLILHLDADAITGLSDNDSVQSWPDMSGNGNHALQEELNNSPVYKTNILNNKPVIRFDGSNDFLDMTNENLDIDNGTLLIVFRTDGSGSDFRGLFIKQYAYGMFVGNNSTGDNHLSTYDWENSTAYAITENVDNGVGRIGVFSFKDGVDDGSSLVLDGTSTTSFTFEIDHQENDGVIGAGSDAGGTQHYNGDIAEILLYNRVLFDLEREEIEAYLQSKWLDI